MSHTPHEFVADFPELAGDIASLKAKDAHFERRLAEYHDVNELVHRAETNIEPLGDLALAEERKKRMHLKDELYRIVTQG
jgi:uncharacterized protein YdcH (DUF465 family)